MLRGYRLLVAKPLDGPVMHGASKPISSILHPRQPWSGGEQVYVCTALADLNGGGLSLQQGSKERKQLYALAKYRGDHDAAAKIVKACLSDHVLDRIIDDVEKYMVAGTPLICAVPHPPFDDISGDGAGASSGGPRSQMPYPFNSWLN